MLEQIEARIKEYETAIANSAANHSGLVGGLNELKNMLSIATKVVEVVDPALAPVLEAAETVVDAL